MFNGVAPKMTVSNSNETIKSKPAPTHNNNITICIEIVPIKMHAIKS